MHFKATLFTVALGASSVLAKDTRTHGVGYFWSSPLVEARMDPIISPGQISSHVHTVIGGDGFGISMDNNAAINSQCTQSRVRGDKSSYWFPALYHHNSDGSFTKVELDYVKAYYFFEATDDEIKPFPPGFRMISGNPFTRQPVTLPYSDNIDPNQGPIQAVSFSCPQSGASNAYPSSISTDAGQGPGFPDAMCNGYASPLRYNIHFPSCINTALPFTDFTNNTAWPSSAGTTGGKSNCPDGYTHTPHLFIEAYWNTMDFTDWTPGQGQQPFVLAQGDPTGHGLHADFVSGWDEDVLTNLINTCDSGAHGDGLDSCPGVQAYSGTPTSCTVASANPSEIVNGTLDALPGCNPIQSGPQTAVLCDCSSGKPVCDGSSGNSTVPTGDSTVSASVTATTTGVSSDQASQTAGPTSAATTLSASTGASGSGGQSNPTPSTALVSSSSAAGIVSSPSETPSSGSKVGGDGGDAASDDSDDDDTCEPDDEEEEESPAPTPEAMVRRHARHLDFHKRAIEHFS